MHEELHAICLALRARANVRPGREGTREEREGELIKKGGKGEGEERRVRRTGKEREGEKDGKGKGREGREDGVKKKIREERGEIEKGKRREGYQRKWRREE